MHNRKFIFFLCLTIIFSAFSAYFIVEAIQGYTPVVRHDEPISVIVAGKDIPAYFVIESVELKEYPKSAVPSGAITRPEDVRGKLSRTFLLEGDIIREGHLSGFDQPAGSTLVSELSVYHDPDLRGAPLSIPAGFSWLNKGDRVNIIYTHRAERGIETRRIFQNVPVLEVNHNERVAFLALSQKDTEQLANAVETGSIMLTYSPVHGR